MISFDHPLVLLLAMPLLGLVALALRHAFANLSTGRLRVAVAIRSALLVALVLALAGTHVRWPQSRQATVVVADLSASDAAERSAMQTFVSETAARRPAGDMLGVVDVGREAVVEQPVSRPSAFGDFQSSVDDQYTNLGAGLDLANALLPAGYQHRVVVLSDGRQNIGDALASARLLRSQSARVDTLALHAPVGPEVLVNSVTVPSQLRRQESFPLAVTIHSTIATTTGLTILRNGNLVASVRRSLHAGQNSYVFPQAPLPPGSYTYRVEITPSRDTQPENNQGSAFTTVEGAPRVLVIADQPREAVNVLAGLRSTGIDAQEQAPSRVIPELSYLQRYAAVVIVDTAADSLGGQLMAQLVPYVRDLGHGLVVLGGQNAYSMGGYGQTPLEQVLPVSTTLPKHQNLPTTAVALIIESLEENTQVNISKEAGKDVVDLLTPQDLLEVSDAPFNGTAGWVVPLQHVTDRTSIGSAIDRMVPGDPDSYVPMLQSAYDTLKRSNARIKHIILLGDGDAQDPAYQDLVTRIRAGGVTVSTVSTNGLGRNDFATMRDIAQWGGGRNYVANDPSKIPQIFLRETRTVSRLGIVQGKFFAEELSANPMLRDLHQVPALYGYVATTPKPAAEIILASPKLDPVLAAWQFGLGRSVAWTSDTAGLWTREWLRSPSTSRFWSNLVSWVFPPANAAQLFVSATSSQGQGHLSVSTPPSLGASPGVTAHVVSPGLTTSTVQLEPSAPGRYTGTFPAGAEGAYFVTVDAHGNGHGDSGQVGLTVPYSPEYRATGADSAFLRLMAAAGGGSLISSLHSAWRNNLPSVLSEYDLSPWLLLLAVLLLPIDIGVRRVIVSRRELATWATSLSRWPARGREQPQDSLASALRPGRRSAGTAAPRMAMSVPRPPRPTEAGRGPVSPTPGRPASSPVPAGGDDESIASKLLAARRTRK